MKHLRLIISMILCIAATYGAAQSVSVQVRDQVEEGRNFSLTLVVKDIDNAKTPESLNLENCKLLYVTPPQSNYYSVNINGKQMSESFMSVAYTFRALKASTITIPAITVTAGGKSYSTKPQKLKIVPASQGSAPSPYSPQRPSADLKEGAKVDAKDYFANDDFFVRINVDKHSVYEQEPVVASITLYTHQNVKPIQAITLPTFEGFLSEEIDMDDNARYGKTTVNGKEYITYVLKRCVLYPQKTGKLKITSGTFDVTLVQRVEFAYPGTPFRDFRTVEKQIKTPEIQSTITVRPLPEPKPASFDGAVGEYTADVSLSSTNLHTNEPATFTYTIKGRGNIKYLKTPVLNLPAGIDQYTPTTDIDAHYANGDVNGTYTATFTIVPQEVGTFQIAPSEFSYFNPSSGQYKTIPLRGFDLHVAKGLSTGAVEQNNISKGITDILHIHPVKDNLTKEPYYVMHQLWYWCLYAIIALALIVIIVVYRRQLKLNADVRGRQLARALKKAMKRFRTARTLMEQHKSEKFYAEISKALWGYLSDKLGIPASQLVRENIAAQLAQYGVDDEGIEDVIHILDECEMARFTPMHTDTDMSELYDKVVQAVKSIENAKK